MLGLVGRDLLLDTIEAVADEDAPAAFALAARAVEMGYDLRAVCRELSRVVRDLLVLSVDPSRVSDPEIAGEGERDRLMALAGAVLARGSAARVRSADAGRSRHSRRGAAALSPRDGAAPLDAPAQARADRGSDRRRSAAAAPAPAVGIRQSTPSPLRRRKARTPLLQPAAPRRAPRRSSGPPPRRVDDAPAAGSAAGSAATGDILKDAFLAEIRKAKAVFYNTVVAQAQKIEVAGDRVTFTFSANQRALRTCSSRTARGSNRSRSRLSGRRSRSAVDAAAERRRAAPTTSSRRRRADKKNALREQALADAGVQAMLEVFPAEIRDVEEM